jgi:hypothetical protein
VGNFAVRLQDIRGLSCTSNAKLSVDQVKVVLTYNAIAENEDSDNFFIAPAQTDLPAIFDYIGNNVCPAARPVVDAVPTTANLLIITHVTNDNSGTATSTDFTTIVNTPTQASQTLSGVSAPGVTLVVPPGSYGVAETSKNGYTEILGDGCFANSSNPILAGETRVCIINNDDIPPPPPLIITPGTWQEVSSSI